MTRNIVTGFCSVALLVLVCVPTVQAGGGQHLSRPAARVDSRWEHKADRNRDGVVDPHEADKAKKDYIKQKSVVDTPWEFRADRNHDGHVGPHEAARVKRYRNR